MGSAWALGNLSRLSARDAIDQPRELLGRAGPGRDGHRGHRRRTPPATSARAGRSRRACRSSPGQTFVLASIDGPGAIQSMWFTGRRLSRDVILRIYWDDQAQPSVECPLGDFFGRRLGPIRPAQLAAGRGQSQQRPELLLGDAVPDAARGSRSRTAAPRRASATTRSTTRSPTCPTTPRTFTRSSGGRTRCRTRASTPCSTASPGAGHYVGTYLAVGVTNSGWWGEGEIKFFIDDDAEFPTICGTGTEDYFGGAYDWDVDGQYVTYTTPFRGHAPGAAARRPVSVPDALRHVPLAHPRPDPLPARACA